MDKRRFYRMAMYGTAFAFSWLGASFGAVPLYRLYCQKTGKGGTPFKDSGEKMSTMKKNTKRLITVRFVADTYSARAWKFEPVQSHVTVYPGESALAFYRARNPLDEHVIGVATYNVIPYEAAIYFNKIQCFCFEEQLLKPKEDVFMPVLFYIDPEFCEDPRNEAVDEVVLSYTFFQSKDGGLYYPELKEDFVKKAIPNKE